MFMIFWAIAFVFFVIVEIATSTALVSIWFAFGSLIALFFAMAKFSFIAQLAIFVVGSIILLIVTRPLARKMQGEKHATNFELDIGKTAIVTETIDNKISQGRVILDGTNWAARTEDDSMIIDEGSIVTVREIQGSKLIVTK